MRSAFVHVFTLCFLAISLTFCTSKKKAAETPAPTAAAAPAASTAETPEQELGEKYSLLKLNAAANALNVIASQKEDDRQQVLACDISTVVAKQSLPALKGLIAQKVTDEREEYVADPTRFSKTNSFDTCGSQCGCGVLVSVIGSVKSTELGSDQWKKDHARDLTRLQKKASLQNVPSEMLACARRQSWYCDSDLRAFLEKPAATK